MAQEAVWKCKVAEGRAERDVLKMEKDVLKMERDMLKTKETELKTERDMIKTERDVIKTERDVIKTERDGLLTENARLRRALRDLAQMISDVITRFFTSVRSFSFHQCSSVWEDFSASLGTGSLDVRIRFPLNDRGFWPWKARALLWVQLNRAQRLDAVSARDLSGDSSNKFPKYNWYFGRCHRPWRRDTGVRRKKKKGERNFQRGINLVGLALSSLTRPSPGILSECHHLAQRWQNHCLGHIWFSFL
ncbi:hypothetical protein NPIL_524421 [Nephila pilipes]|uniref:Uncharacterized protein n=1 Tax=Nephila pilipes TaxID=299642 RepID=A0A8X6T0G2_NEPPI|nr:hypothetical protein NPIL_524421 [Nephila pilipes]